MTEEVFRMVDMEQKLADDRDGSYRDSLCLKLADDRAAIKRRIDVGLPPEEFERASRLLAAHDSAERVLKTLWATVHRQ